MKKIHLILILVSLLASLPGARAQQSADRPSFETVARCGDVAVVRSADEYRLVVGRRPSAPKLSLLLGGTAAQASARMGRIRTLGAESTYVQDGRSVVFCGEMFSLSMGGVETDAPTRSGASPEGPGSR